MYTKFDILKSFFETLNLFQDFDTVLQATVRLLGIWLSQEPIALKSMVQPRLTKWMKYG